MSTSKFESRSGMAVLVNPTRIVYLDKCECGKPKLLRKSRSREGESHLFPYCSDCWGQKIRESRVRHAASYARREYS